MLVEALRSVPWLCSAAICTFLVTYVVAVLMALLHPVRERRADARAVLDRHIFTPPFWRGGYARPDGVSGDGRSESHGRAQRLWRWFLEP